MTAILIPSIGGPYLQDCLNAVTVLDPPPRQTLVVLSGGASPPSNRGDVEFYCTGSRLGFAAAVNTGLARLSHRPHPVALLNDDALPAPGWLGVLETALDGDPTLAAVQGTVTDADGSTVDSRGITFDTYGLPVHVDDGRPMEPEPGHSRAVIAVSATAALFREEALRQTTLGDGSVFDHRFGSYHEDVDLGLRLHRLGWNAAWVPGARVRHTGSATGRSMKWRHPWWLLTNRWRAIAGNLTSAAMLRALPTLLRGDFRAVRTLSRRNPRAIPTAAAAWTLVPWLVIRSLGRPSPGPRLTNLPEAES